MEAATIVAMLAHARRNGVTVLLKEAQLFVKTEKGSTPDAGILAALKAHKQEILHFLKNREADATADNDITRISRSGSAMLPLSFGQERLWMVHQLMGSVQYHLPVILRLKGVMEAVHPEQAILAIVDRHEVLRTVFKEKDGAVYQQILPAGGWHFDINEVAAGEEDLPGFITQYINRPFDLAAGYMLRSTLLKVGAQEHILIVVMHHIAADGWSVPILVKEFIANYRSFKSGRYVALPAPRIQYADYAAWQRNQLDPQQLLYWEQRLLGMQQLELPADHPRPLTPQTAGRVFTCKLEHALREGLEQLSEKEGVTLFMTLLSVFKVLLFRYSGQEDLCAGIAVAGRSRRATEELVGFFVNMLVIRTMVKGTLSFSELLQQVKQHTLEAYAHQDVPFELVAERLLKVRDSSRHPLFQAAFILQNLPKTPDIVLDDVAVQLEEPVYTASKFDISFEITANKNIFSLRIEYSSVLFDETTIHQLAAHYEQLLKSVVLSPLEQVQQLRMLQEEEQQQLLETFNHTSHPFRDDQTITGLIEAQAAKTPEAAALVFKGKYFTFKEVNERANRLAAWLRKYHEIHPDDLIGVQLERSEWLVIALLAVLKSGGAYVPVDPEFPATRIAQIIKESRCKVLLNGELLQQFREEEMRFDGVNLPVVNTPDNLIYVIYTSGSTGTPKGVMMEHRSIVNRLQWMWEHYQFTARDIILQKTNVTFDVSVWEIFMPLCMGARMVLCERDDIRSPQRLQTLIAAQQVSCLHFVSGMLDAFMSALFKAGAPAELNSLRLVITSGEALRADTVHQWYRYMQAPLHNLYGPTEAAVDVTFFPASKTDDYIPIGRPVWNTKILILDPANGLVPVGGTGEICIEGVGLARGYLNNLALTAEKFADHPYRAGAKMYRTGDYGKWLPDGNIIYLGRRDGQVKIRGYRIETGEVEAAINALVYIQACVVVPRPDVYGQPELVAYIVSGQELDATLLRTDLAHVLPAYMLPAHYVQLEQLPVSGSGKTDRKNLPDPTEGSISGKAAYIQPSGETEQKLVLIWQEVLGISSVGTADNFFELGGNSIKLIRMVGLVNQAFSADLAVVNAFKLPTVKDIALYLQEGNAAAPMELAEMSDDGVNVMKNSIHLLNRYNDEE
jgi:tyrocidine synthetase-3